MERAAGYARKSLSKCLLGQALHAGDEVIQAHETRVLDEADWSVFLDALENPPGPNLQLKRAFAEDQKRVRP